MFELSIAARFITSLQKRTKKGRRARREEEKPLCVSYSSWFVFPFSKNHESTEERGEAFVSFVFFAVCFFLTSGSSSPCRSGSARRRSRSPRRSDGPRRRCRRHVLGHQRPGRRCCPRRWRWLSVGTRRPG